VTALLLVGGGIIAGAIAVLMLSLARVAGAADAYLDERALTRADRPASVAPMTTTATGRGDHATAAVTPRDLEPRAELGKLRRRLGVGQAELAQAAGMDERTVRRVENDPTYRPRLEQVLRMADALGADVLLKVRE